MTRTKDENWVEEIGKPAFEGIAEMVAALECDYDRLEELRDERDDWEPAETCQNCGKETTWEGTLTKGEKECKHCTAIVSWASQNPDDAEELAELERAAGECEDREDAEQRIQEDPLCVEVRTGWVTPGKRLEPSDLEEFCILLTTGGPAVRILGELDGNGEPCRAWLEVQDWGKPWTEYVPADRDTLLAYARCFYFVV